MPPRPDLNLLSTLDALLADGSVARAARRLKLSPSAMSRALSRLRAATGDPLLVRAGRGLVLTPRALELREQVGLLVRGAEAALRPAESPRLDRLARTLTIRARDGFVETFGAALLDRVGRDAPGARLRFVAKPERDSTRLRDGAVDLEIGVVGVAAGPELRTRVLFRDRFVGAVHADHPLLGAKITPARFAAARHVDISRREVGRGPVDDALAKLGLARDVAAAAPDFGAALALARTTRLVATVPERFTAGLSAGLQSFALPFATPPVTISALWHPRVDADPVNRWLRGCVLDACAR